MKVPGDEGRCLLPVSRRKGRKRGIAHAADPADGRRSASGNRIHHAVLPPPVRPERDLQDAGLGLLRAAGNAVHPHPWYERLRAAGFLGPCLRTAGRRAAGAPLSLEENARCVLHRRYAGLLRGTHFLYPRHFEACAGCVAIRHPAGADRAGCRRVLLQRQAGQGRKNPPARDHLHR